MNETSVAVLGPLLVDRQGSVAPLTGRPAQLLGLLVLHRSAAVDEAQLVTELWDGAPLRTSSSAFRTYLAAVRKAIGPEHVVVMDGTYRLAAQVAVDIDVFAAFVDRARNEADPRESLELYQNGLRLWRGQPFQSLPQQILRAEKAALQEQCDRVEEEVIWIRVQLGYSSELVDELQRMVHRRPLREIRTSMLMRVLADSGRAAEALRAYQWLYGHLRDEVGTTPGPDLVTLERLILQGRTEPLPRAGVSKSRPGVGQYSHVVPLKWQQAAFGFVDASAAITSLIAPEPRVVLVLSRPGFGKTSHAGELVRRLLDAGELVLAVDGATASDATFVELTQLLPVASDALHTLVVDDVDQLDAQARFALIELVTVHQQIRLRLFGDVDRTDQSLLEIAGPAIKQLVGLPPDAILALGTSTGRLIQPWDAAHIHQLCNGHPGDVRWLVDTLSTTSSPFDLSALRLAATQRTPPWAHNVSAEQRSVLAMVLASNESLPATQFPPHHLVGAAEVVTVLGTTVSFCSPWRRIVAEAVLGAKEIERVRRNLSLEFQLSFAELTDLDGQLGEFVSRHDAGSALMLIDRALEVVDANQSAAAVDLQLRRAELLELMGNSDAGREVRLGLLRSAPGDEFEPTFLETLLWPEATGRSYAADTELEPYFAKALEQAAQHDRVNEQTMLHSEWVIKSAFDPQRSPSTTESIQWVRSATASDPKTDLVLERARLIADLTDPTTATPQRERVQHQILLARRLNNADVEAGAISLASHVALAQGDRAWWDRALVEAEGFAVRSGRPADLWARDVCRATHSLLHGKMRLATHQAANAFEIGVRYSLADADLGDDTFDLFVAWHESMLGNLSEWSKVRLSEDLAFARFSLMLKKSFERTIAADDEHLAAAVHGALSLTNEFFALPLMAMVAQAVWNVSAVALAEPLLARFEASNRAMIAVGLPPVACFGPTRRYSALLYTLTNQHQIAEQRIDEAIDVASSFRSSAWVTVLEHDRIIMKSIS